MVTPASPFSSSSNTIATMTSPIKDFIRSKSPFPRKQAPTNEASTMTSPTHLSSSSPSPGSPPKSPLFSSPLPNSPAPKVKSNISQTDLISDLEKTPEKTPLTNAQMKEKADRLTKLFIEKSTKFAQVNFLYKGAGEGAKTKEDYQKILAVVKDLSKHKSPGFFRIRAAMLRQFKNLSFFRMLFVYYSFVLWVPGLYIKKVVNKILTSSREELKAGKNLPALGSMVIDSANEYLTKYNEAVKSFSKDDTSPIGNRNKYLEERLQHPDNLGYPSVKHLYNAFAKAASKEKMRPDFSHLSNTIKKIQLLDLPILRKIPRIFKLPIQGITLTIGTIPFVIAKLLEVIPNAIINIFQRKMIASFAPSILDDVLNGVSGSGFSYAIDTFLCDVIKDAMLELDKDPYLKSTKELQNRVDKSLNDKIKYFSKELFTLISKEPYQSKEALKRVEQNGLDGNSTLETLLKFPSAKIAKFLDRKAIEEIFVDKALHPNIIMLFNFLCQPDKFEEHLGNLLELLNTIYDDVPDPSSPEGKILKQHQDEKQTRKEELVKKLIKKAITEGTDDGLNEWARVVSKTQNNDLIFSYRKIKAQTLNNLPGLEQDGKNLLSSCKVLIDSFSPINSKTQAKLDIELAKNDLNNLFVIIKNIMPKENGPVKSSMQNHLNNFMVHEKILSDSLNKIDTMHDEIEQLKSLSNELKKFKNILNYKHVNLNSLKKQLKNLQKLKSNLKFDQLIDKYTFLSDQFEIINTHENYISTLKGLLTNTFFKSSLLLDLSIAQKAYINAPKSNSKEKRLKALNEKILASLNTLEPIANDADIAEMKDAIRKISMAADSQKINTAYLNAKALFEKKLSKHRSLLKDEKEILTTKCLEKSKSSIKKQENAFPELFQNTHKDLMNHAETFNSTITKLKDVVNKIDQKKSWTDVKILKDFNEMNGITKFQAIASIASLALWPLGFLGPYLSILGAAGSVASIRGRPLRSLASHAAVPLANASYESAERLIRNRTFYQGLFHDAMGTFINFANKK